MARNTGLTRPAWHLKEIGSRVMAIAFETMGEDFFKKLQLQLKLNSLDIEIILSELEFYYDRACARSPHIEGKGVEDFAAALEPATFGEWSESSKSVRGK